MQIERPMVSVRLWEINLGVGFRISISITEFTNILDEYLRFGI